MRRAGASSARRGRPGIVGVNIGANKDSTDRIADYVLCIERLCGLADFLTINVSSPNTPGLRDLQGEAFLDDLLARCIEARDKADHGRRKTIILLKIAPDISLDALDAIVTTALRRGVDGLTVSNTTIARPDSLQEKALAAETGGLSGKPLFVPSTRLLAETFLRVERRIPLIGVGGIDSAEAAWAKIRAGASLSSSIRRWSTRDRASSATSSAGWCRRSKPRRRRWPQAIGRDAVAIAQGRF